MTSVSAAKALSAGEGQPAGRARRDWLLPVLAGLFFASGLTALVYQVLWLRLLGLVFGVTTYAAGTVLASFFAGLALGSLVAGPLSDRARRPLFLYGVAEVLVALTALASPLALDAVQALYVEVAPSLPSGLGPLTAARFVLAFAVLVVPATLMGATLPLVLRSSLARGDRIGGRAGVLYGTNTAGAIVGTLLAGFVLIGGIGIAASFAAAAALNLLVGICAILASRRLEDGAPPAAAVEAPPVDGQRVSRRARRLVLVVFGLSGLASLALEVVWFRLLVHYLDVTTYAFSVMLGTVLLGIAAGSWLVTPLLRRRGDWLRVLALLELAIGVLAMLSLAGLARAYDVLDPATPLVLHQAPVMPAVLLFLTSALTMLPATVLLGAAFPIGLSLWVDGGAPGKQIGRFYSVNVVGGIAGSVLAAFVLVPQLGSRASLVVAAAIPLVCGLALLFSTARRARTFAVAAATVGTAVFVGAALGAPDPLEAAAAQRHPGEQVLLREEGVQSTVSVQRRRDGVRALYLDGLHQTNDSPGQVDIHRRIGQLPMALHPDPREALVIGLGGGATAGGASLTPGAAVDVVELSPGVVRAARLFDGINAGVLRRRNVRLRVDDGRNFLLLARQRYDVIAADIIQPYHAGAGNLYSSDYFRLARGALEEDGLMLQWIGGADAAQHRLIMRTFLAAFPHATLWNESLMVGSKRPLRLSRAAFERKLRDAAGRAAVGAIGVTSFDSLLAAYTTGPDALREFVGPGPVLTDDRPRIEYFRSLPAAGAPVDLARLRRGDVRRLVVR